jgi:phage-related protein
MTSISSFLPSASNSTTAANGVKKTPTAFDINAKEFGPTAATAIGVAAAATDAVGSTVSFSKESLSKLADLAGSAVDGVETAITGVGDSLSTLGHDVADEFKKAYGAVEHTVSSVVSAVEDAADTLEDGVSSMASAVGDAASYVKDGVTAAADKATFYAAAGLNALL